MRRRRTATSKWSRRSNAVRGTRGREFRPAWQPASPRRRYLAVLDYLPADERRAELIDQLRATVRRRSGLATTYGVGPRYLHSTGQFHKGGPNNGVFVLLTAADASATPVPGMPYTFSTLKQAQALGDFEALVANGSRGRSLPPRRSDRRFLGDSGTTARARLSDQRARCSSDVAKALVALVIARHARRERPAAPARAPSLQKNSASLSRPIGRSGSSPPHHGRAGHCRGRTVADIGAGGGWFTIRLARASAPTAACMRRTFSREMIESIGARDTEDLNNVQTILGTPTDPSCHPASKPC